MSRVIVVLPLLLACASAACAGAEPVVASPSASILLHLHPRPWQPPAALGWPGLPALVESPGGAPEAALAAEIAARRAARAAALAGIPVQLHADGSRYAVLAGAVRAYALARVGADGALEEDCADSESDAIEWLAAPAAPAPAKGEK